MMLVRVLDELLYDLWSMRLQVKVRERHCLGAFGAPDLGTGSAAWAIHHAGGDGITDDLFGLRIPLDGAGEPFGDAAELTDGGGAMADVDVGDRLLAGLDAV